MELYAFNLILLTSSKKIPSLLHHFLDLDKSRVTIQLPLDLYNNRLVSAT